MQYSWQQFSVLFWSWALQLLPHKLDAEIFLVALTTLVYMGSQELYKRTNSILLNPVLISIAVLVFFLLFFDIEYTHYQKNTQVISFWLNPSVVALAIPLYLQMKRIKKDWKRIILATLSGAVIGIVSVVLIAKFLGASKEIILAIAPKSVSTPIAIRISETVGGIRFGRKYHSPIESQKCQCYRLGNGYGITRIGDCQNCPKRRRIQQL